MDQTIFINIYWKSCKRNSSHTASCIHSITWYRRITIWLNDGQYMSSLYKKGTRTSSSNYRPISLTSVCSKTMEHIIYHSVMEHLNSNNILIDDQHGFRSQHSCVTQLISLVEDLPCALDTCFTTLVLIASFRSISFAQQFYYKDHL